MRILVVTGSSGGHLFPAISFLETLKSKQKDAELLLVLPGKCVDSNPAGEGYEIKYLPIVSFKPGIDPENFSRAIKLFQGAISSIRLLLKFKPDLVVGFGTLNSAPLVMFAWALRIKTMIHEQNLAPGKANRLLSRFCDKVAVSFSQSKDYFKVNPRKIIVTGNPLRKRLVRKERKAAEDFFGFKENGFTLLVMGGSAGSHNINLAFLKAFSGLPDKDRIRVVHICGVKDFPLLKEAYRDLSPQIRLFPFLKEMEYAYSASDLVISRSGATTIAEIAYFRIPSILAPYPYAYNHQLHNAMILKDCGAALVIDDRDLEAGVLKEKIDFLRQGHAALDKMRLAFERLDMPKKPDQLADLALGDNF